MRGERPRARRGSVKAKGRSVGGGEAPVLDYSSPELRVAVASSGRGRTTRSGAPTTAEPSQNEAQQKGRRVEGVGGLGVDGTDRGASFFAGGNGDATELDFRGLEARLN